MSRVISTEELFSLCMGGRMTAFDVHIEYYPCHITSLPVAVNLQCHSVRQASVEP